MTKQKLFAIGLFFSIFLAPPVILAKTEPVITQQVAPSPTPQISGEVLGIKTTKVDYVLPYPGISLDHPLYVLKNLRDQILEKLISDPIRKAEFYILQADKFTNMGIFAHDGGKKAIVGKAITQGEWYLEKAITNLIALKNNGIPIPGRVIDRLEKATAKHIEVLEELLTKVDASQKDAVATALALVKKLQGEVIKLK